MAKAANPERSAFLRSLKQRQNELAESAKKEASTPFLSDEETIELLGLSETRQQFRAKVSRVRYGLDKHKNEYFSINYVLTEGEHEGTTVSQFYGLGGKTKDERAKKDARLCGAFQRLNVDTTKWAPTKVSDKLVESADMLTETKPNVVLSLYTWGDDPDDPRLGIDITSCGAPTPVKKGKPAKAEEEEEEDEYEEADEEEVEGEEEETEEGEDLSEWVGYEASFDTGDGAVSVSTTEYDANTGLFTVEDENGDLYEASFEDLDFGT